MGQSSGDAIRFVLKDELANIVNVGLGIECRLNERVELYGSFNTDFSAAKDNVLAFVDNEDEASNSVLTANFFHYAAGALLKFRIADLTLGSSRASGSQDFG